MPPSDTQAILAEAFSQSGAQALPYAPEFRGLVQQHFTELTQDLPALHVKTRDFVQNDGRTSHLLLAEGTVPMYYQGVKYNIPVALWLPERYPLQAPMAYVVPTPDMIIKPRHSFVDSSGLVNTLYITRWQYPSCNLREMVQDMSMHFGDDPPLFSKPKGWVEPPKPQPRPPVPAPPQPPRPAAYPSYGADTVHVNPLTQQQQPPKPQPAPAASGGSMDSIWGAVLAAAGGAAAGGAAGVAAGAAAAAAKPPPPQPPPRVDPTPRLAEAFKAAAQATLNKRLHASLSAIAQQAAAEGDEQLRLQATLRQRGEQLQQEVAALQAERLALDKLSQDLSASSAQLDRWLADNEHLAAAADDPSKLDPDVLIAAADALSQAAVEVQAQDLALEDALYALDKALNSGAVEADAYLKQVRAVCRRQFFVRAVGHKVAVAQQEAQRRAPQQQAPPRYPGAQLEHTLSSGRAVVLPQGDSWANTGTLASSQSPPPPGGSWFPAP